MISTGVTELDQRLGGLTGGRYYLLTGTPGAGKTSACLHFIAEGLKNGETCAILTQENPDDLFSQAEFVGYDMRDATEREDLLLLQYRLDFSTNYARTASPALVARELISMLDQKRPKRLIVDSILPFVQAGGATHGAVSALLQVLDELQPTAYFTVPGDLGDSFYARLYDPLVSGAAGILHFDMWRGDVRQMTIRKIRQAPLSTQPLRFVLRAGVGIVEATEAPLAPVPVEAQRRVALVNIGGRVGGDLYASLRIAYDLQTYDTLESAAHACATNSFAAVLIAIDSFEAEEGLSFISQLRKAKNAVPVVMISKRDGLRASTRTRALRAGADEFVTDDASPQEFLAKVETARLRGPRSIAERLRRDTVLTQPVNDKGEPMLVTQESLARAIRQQIATSSQTVFGLARLVPADGSIELLWQTLASQLRIADGDLIALTDHGELMLYLPDVSRRHVGELLSRIFQADPRLTAPEITIQHYPADAARVEPWLASASTESQQLLRAHG